MYIYFDYSGNLKEIVSYPVRQGDDNSKTVYVYVESSANPQMSDDMYKLPANITTASIAFKLVDTDENLGNLNAMSKVSAGLEIPYDKSRDLKYFKYWKKYQFWKYTLQSAQTVANGVVAATVTLSDNVAVREYVLDTFAFNVQASVGIVPDSSLNVSQYQYLFSRITGTVPYQGATNDVNLGNHSLSANSIGVYNIFQDNTVWCGGFGSSSNGTLTVESENAVVLEAPHCYVGSVSTNNEIATQGWANSNYVNHRNESGLKAYVSISGTDNMMKITGNPEEGIASRDSNGCLRVGTPTVDDHATTKKYVDDGFVPSINQPNRIYGVNNVGNQTTFGYSADTRQLIVSRSGGRFQAEEPLVDKDVANKEYVNAAIGRSLYKHDVEIYVTGNIFKKLRFTVYDHNINPYNTIEKLWEFKGLLESGPYLKSLEQMCFACNTSNREGIAVRFYLHSNTEKIDFQIYRFYTGTGNLDRLESVSWNYADLTIVDYVEEL